MKILKEDVQLKNSNLTFDKLQELVYNVMQSVGGDLDDFGIVDQNDYIQISYDSYFEKGPKDIYGSLKNALETQFGKNIIRKLQYKKNLIPVEKGIDYSIYFELDKNSLNAYMNAYMNEDKFDSKYFDIVRNDVGNYLAMHKDKSKAYKRTLLSGETSIDPFCWAGRKSTLISALNYIE